MNDELQAETLDLLKFIKQTLKGEVEVFQKTVKKFGTSAHILVPRKYIGRDITLITSQTDVVLGEKAPQALGKKEKDVEKNESESIEPSKEKVTF